ncbi:probable amidase At4g34880 [Prosopis cineraria]|uniref:probable amidase At4g34880 n=1 Tax=Prosopis cineraria TaxID=364024 RepID=UPI00240FBCF6|nr:probable amidase At4g34880 [Prosopis cineraria]
MARKNLCTSSALNHFFSLQLILITILILPSPRSHAFQFREATVDDIQYALTRGHVSSTQLVHFYRDQIQRYNQVLRGVTEVNPDAEAQAHRADSDRLAGKRGSRLSGVPVLIKDNTATKDHMNTSAGSFALVGSVVARDAFVVKKLRDAGAIILGKTSLKEWSGFRSSSMPGGWSARGGQGKNPYNLSKEVCGSSSGSAISVAANFATVAIGTETDGSIICPSSYNSVVGIKPTVNLTSRDGVVPISMRQDSVGPMARSVADAVHVLDIIVGRDENDRGTIEASRHIPNGGYAQYLNSEGLSGKRLGILRFPDYFNFPDSSIQNATYQQLFHTFREKGATVVDDVVIEHNDEIHENEMIALLAEIKRDLNSYLSNLRFSPSKSMAELILFNTHNKNLESIEEYPQDMFLMASQTNGINETVQEALAKLERFSKNGFEKTMKEKKLDALVYVGQKYVPFLGVGGYPSITVPVGYTHDNMPLVIAFGGLKYSEPKLIEIAYALEHTINIRKPPPLDDLLLSSVETDSYQVQAS